jgi:hypothetical protein
MDRTAAKHAVRAACHPENGAFAARFDAAPWLASAPVEAIVAMAQGGYRSEACLPALRHLARLPGYGALAEAMRYSDRCAARGASAPLEAYVHEPDVIAFLMDGRPEALLALRVVLGGDVYPKDVEPFWERLGFHWLAEDRPAANDAAAARAA